MKTRSVMIALAAIAMLSVSAQANECCEMNGGGTAGITGCVSAATINQAACVGAKYAGTFTTDEFCDVGGTCEPKPGPGGTVCENDDASNHACCDISEDEIECANVIPTVSEWGLIVMIVLVLTAGTLVFSRRRRPATA